MFGKVSKNQRDNERVANADRIFNSLEDYYKTNFKTYPVPLTTDSSLGYRSIIIGKDSDAFLQIALKDEVQKLNKEPDASYGYVYIYSPDGQKAAIVVRKLEAGEQRCNTKSENLPEIIQDYLTKDPKACYYKTSS